VSQGAPASSGSGSLDDPSSGDADDLPEYRLHPNPPLYRYWISSKVGRSSSTVNSSRRDQLNSVYSSPSQDKVLDSPVLVEAEDKTADIGSPVYSTSSPLPRAYPPTPPPFAPELSKDLRTQESGGLGPFSLLDQLQPSLW